MLARSRPAQLQVKPGSENKKGKVHSPAEDLLVPNNMGKENRRAERKRAKRHPRLLVPDNTNSVFGVIDGPGINPGPFCVENVFCRAFVSNAGISAVIFEYASV
jgi:hypothetical protein